MGYKTTLCDVSLDGGHYGIAAPAVDFKPGLPAYLRITDINDDGTLNPSDRKSVDDSSAGNYLLHEGDIVFARTGNSTGRNYYYDPRDGEYAYAGFLIKFSLDPRKINPRYMKYYAQSKQYWDWVSSFNTGSTRGNINAKTYASMPIDLLSRQIQDGIVAICDAIDDKIRINRQLNDYLEQCLLARYDHLFRGAGTYNGTISDIGDVVGGATPSKKRPEYYCHEGIGWITPKDLSNTTNKFVAHGADDITRVGFDSCSIKKLPAGTVLFSSRAPIGYIAIASDEVTTNQGFKSIVPHKEIGTAFVYCFLVRNKDRIADAGSGTTFPEVSGKTMAGIELTLPNINLCAKFEEWASPLLEEQRHLEDENRQLEDLRDTLLPKLMSGEIDVSKVDLTQLTNNHLADY
ncbi:restriction endonuclease subunit S [Bifidobacterium pseudocatenulatum]|uniref:restriction endonuclease subunit S n=1 Tax=Bifidobacterium TaxID=1678 RepID=UPI0022E8C260|nr:MULTISPECIES: restriction endonuclease subunit S [Bifidobacterium]MDH7887917.1 restriction endonuclease subunit S [Bifidobacterium catenulatum subsp. kashiwanohense]